MSKIYKLGIASSNNKKIEEVCNTNPVNNHQLPVSFSTVCLRFLCSLYFIYKCLFIIEIKKNKSI